MGQAKYRKERDPLYGTYSNTVRGLIITTPMSVSGDTFSVSTPELDPQELRNSLLYWDRLLLPTTNIIGGGSTEEISFLKTSGILETPTYRINGPVASEMKILPWRALEACEIHNPGMWSVGGGSNSIQVANSGHTGTSGCQIQLYNALPTPEKNVPLAEILDFRRLRRAELLAFRSHMDSMVKEIEGSSDSDESLKQRLKELDKACADLATVCREWQTPFKLTNLKATFNLSLEKAFTSAAKTWIALEKTELDYTAKALGASLAAVSSQFKLEREISFRSIRRKGSPYKFLYEAQQNLPLN